jgi:predicted metal-dependent hydrolase
MRVELSHGRRRFVIDVVSSDRKRLTITVHPDLRITAKAPAGYKSEVIRTRLEKRASWIAKQLDYFLRFQPLPVPRKFISGETHYYLGRQYRLKIRNGKNARVRLIGRFFEMELPNPKDRKKARTLMLDWYSTHARNLLVKRLDLYLPIFLKKGAAKPKILYRCMKKRWGSCSTRGTIVLNTELVKAPSHCIDYVIIHELCHLLHPHHDRKFYSILGRILPDWERRKERLERVII